MELTLFWAIVVPIAIIIFLILGYKAWQRNRLRELRRARRRGLADEQAQMRYSQTGSSVDEWTASTSSPSIPPLDEQPQSRPFSSGEARTQAGPPPRFNSGEDRTETGPSKRGDFAEDRTHLGRSQKNESLEERTEIGRKRKNKVNPEDDRTVF